MGLSPLAQLSISEAIEDIVAMTVVGRLSQSGALKVDLGRYASVRVPGRAVHPGDAGVWVQEGQPIPTRQFQLLGGPLLTPQKLACIVPLTREITEASNIEEAVVRGAADRGGRDLARSRVVLGECSDTGAAGRIAQRSDAAHALGVDRL